MYIWSHKCGKPFQFINEEMTYLFSSFSSLTYPYVLTEIVSQKIQVQHHMNQTSNSGSPKDFKSIHKYVKNNSLKALLVDYVKVL